MKTKTKEAICFISSLVIILIGLVIALNVQRDISYNFNEYCDNEYGKGNWITVPADRTNISLINKHYIGEIWTCVEKTKSLGG